jgi:hypothetical protein
MEYKTLEQSSFKEVLGMDSPAFNSSNASFFATSSFVYMLLFTAIVGAAFYEYVLVGIYRMEASESGIRKSNETFKRTTLGLLGVFSLFLIIFTLNKSLLTGNVSLGELKDTNKPTASQAATPAVTAAAARPISSVSNPSIPTNNDDPTGWNAIKNDATVREQLRNLPNGGITVNKKVCNNPTQTSCTTVGGLPSETLAMLSSLRSACGGVISITGGTEAGHRSHGPGKSPVDLSINSPGGLEACIRNFPASKPLDFCKKTYSNFGYIFCDERGIPHWHVFR